MLSPSYLTQLPFRAVGTNDTYVPTVAIVDLTRALGHGEPIAMI